MTHRPKRTPAPGSDERQRPTTAAMTAEERAVIRKAGSEDARRSRARQGLPERIEDPPTVALLAALLRATRAVAPKESSRRHGRKTAA